MISQEDKLFTVPDFHEYFQTKLQPLKSASIDKSSGSPNVHQWTEQCTPMCYLVLNYFKGFLNDVMTNTNVYNIQMFFLH